MNSEEHKLKVALRLALILICVMAILLFYNYTEIKKLKEISAGEYFTDQQCREMYSIVAPFNISVFQIESNDSVRSAELQT